MTRCRACKSPDLFSAYFDSDDLAVQHEVGDGQASLIAQVAAGVRWTTFCNHCGSEVKS